MATRPPLRVDRLECRTVPAPIGSPDPTFGFGGRPGVGPGYFESFFVPTDPVVRALTVLPDGRALVLSAPPSFDPAGLRVTRLLANGRPDPTFGGFGEARVAFDDPAAVAVRGIGVAGQPAGRATVVAAVGPAVGPPTRVGLVGLNPLGQVDIAFGAAGRRLVDLPAGFSSSFAGAAAAGVPGGGAVVAVPLAPVAGGPPAVGVLRVTRDGSPDPGFGAGGFAVVPFGTGVVAGVAVAPDGAVVVGATADRGGGNTDFAVARLLADGRPDPGFGAGGVAVVGFDLPGTAGADTPAAVAVGPDGRVVVAGAVEAGPGGNTDFGVARLLADGALDPGFDGDGRARVGVDRGGANADRATAVAVLPDGRVVVAGAVEVPAPTPPPPPGLIRPDLRPSTVAVARLLADGAPDPRFGRAGVREEPAAPGSAFQSSGGFSPDFYSAQYTADRPAAVGVQPGGRVLVGITSSAVSVSQFQDFFPPPDCVFVPGGVPRRSGSAFTTGQVLGLVGRIGLPAGAAVGGPGAGAAVDLTPGPDGVYAAGNQVAPLGGGGPVRAARADFDGDGVEDTAYAAGPGGPPTVRVVSGRTGGDLAGPFPAFEETFVGGLFVAAGDFDGDGRAELVVTPDRGGGPRVRVLAVGGGLVNPVADFFGIDDKDFRGGARAAVGDVTGDGVPDLVVGAGFGGGPRVALFDGRSVAAVGPGGGTPGRVVGDFLAFPGADAGRLRDGVYLAAGDLTGDGFAEVVAGGGPGGAPRVVAFDGPLLTAGDPDGAAADPVANFFAGDPAARGGARVAVRDADGDARADLLVGTGENEPARVRVYRAAAVVGRPAPTADQELAPFGGEAVADGLHVG